MFRPYLMQAVRLILPSLFLISVVNAEALDDIRYAPNEILIKYKRSAADALEQSLIAGKEVNEIRMSASLNNLAKKHPVKKIEQVFPNFKKSRKKYSALVIKNNALLNSRESRLLRRSKRAPMNMKVPELDRIYKLTIELEKKQSLEDVVAAYNNDPDIEYAELNYIVSHNAVPNDSLFPLQWPLHNTGQYYPHSGRFNTPPGTPDSDIDAPQAWDITANFGEVVVAVIDTGVDYNHRDLQNNIWINYSELNGTAGVDDDQNGFVDDIHGYNFIYQNGDPLDDHGHGTHCAGVIAAHGNNGLDIAGISWNTKIMSLKFLSYVGRGYTDDAMKAFYYLTDNGADVASNSWGGGDFSMAMQDAINYAYSQGVIMAASAGNAGTDDFQYPANYDNMISVAATDSNDQKAPFSSYGDWVDIAAPGVDVLSLRAAGTSMGSTYNLYTTIASGTSMSCPHIAGACAFLLSCNSTLGNDDVYSLIMDTVDPIAPGICASNGRVNLANAGMKLHGNINLEQDYYSCSSEISIELMDSHLQAQGTQMVSIVTTDGDTEIVTLQEDTATLGFFTGTILTASGFPDFHDGTLQISHGQTITVIYDDLDNGLGNPRTVTDTAQADCLNPVISNIHIDTPGSVPTVTLETDEPTTIRMLFGESCAGPFMSAQSSEFLTSHSIDLTGVSPQTDYYFQITAYDVVGNETMEDNEGRCFTFTTDSPGDIYVPSDYSNIQRAIEVCWPGYTVWVEDGTYSGQGNYSIDFMGRAITVKSQTGPDNCIIDCMGQGRGFIFHNNEDANSVLDGFSIINGFDNKKGGGIYCRQSSPTIKNCVLSANSAPNGGGMFNESSNPSLVDCTFSDNLSTSATWFKGGGAIFNTSSSPTMLNCLFVGNQSSWDGGGVNNTLQSSPTLMNCIFTSNSALGNDGGAMFNLFNSNPAMINCTFNGNRAASWGGAVRNRESDPTFTNCLFTGNLALDNGGAIFNFYYSSAVLNNCTFGGNSANGHAGDGMYNRTDCYPTVTNCIFWDSKNEIYDSQSHTTISCSDIQGRFPDEGNLNVDPLFINPGYWDGDIWINGDYHLRWDSPCIDAGCDTAVFEDLDGNIRPWDIPYIDNNGPNVLDYDIGAYEYIPQQVHMNITPQKLNLCRKGNWVKAHFIMPANFSINNIDVDTPALLGPLGIESDHINLLINEDNLVEAEIVFDRGEFGDATSNYLSSQITVTGSFIDGSYFYGSDNISITIKPIDYLIALASHWLQTDCREPNWCDGFDLDHNSVINLVDFTRFDSYCFEVSKQ